MNKEYQVFALGVYNDQMALQRHEESLRGFVKELPNRSLNDFGLSAPVPAGLGASLDFKPSVVAAKKRLKDELRRRVASEKLLRARK